MDYVTRQFVNLAKKLRDDFRKTLSSVNGDLHEIKKAIQSIDKNAKAYEDKEQPKPEVFAILHETESSEAERHTANRGTKRRDRVRLAVEWLTLIAVTFYGYVAVRQWREMIQARHQVERSIIVSNRTAGAAEKANFAAFEASRPWIGIVLSLTPPRVANIGGGQSNFVFYWRFKNSGHRPALIRQIHTIGDFYKECTTRPIYDNKNPPSRGLIMPDGEFNAAFGSIISTDKFELVRQDNLTYCIYVAIEYEDVMNPTVLHHSRFCSYVLGDREGNGFASCHNNYDYAD